MERVHSNDQPAGEAMFLEIDLPSANDVEGHATRIENAFAE